MKMIVLFLLSFWVAQASAVPSYYCFEMDKENASQRTAWSHIHLSVKADNSWQGSDGRWTRGINGYGWNDAGDSVPITGSALRLPDGKWILSFMGTLQQFSTLANPVQGGKPRYWLSTFNFIFNNSLSYGTGFMGNDSESWHQFPDSANDGVYMIAWQTGC